MQLFWQAKKGPPYLHDNTVGRRLLPIDEKSRANFDRWKNVGMMFDEDQDDIKPEPDVYSKRLKSERSDFGAFQSCPIPKRFGFQTFGLLTGTKRNVRFSEASLS